MDVTVLLFSTLTIEDWKDWNFIFYSAKAKRILLFKNAFESHVISFEMVSARKNSMPL